MTRVYISASLPQVLAWSDAGAVPAGSTAHAVTPGLRAAHQQADEEELEFLATQAAHDEAQRRAGGGRPAVLAVDVVADIVMADGATAVTVVPEVPRDRWAALFLDDLEWFAVEEISHLR